MSWLERVKVLLSGRVWLWVWMGGGTPPVSVTVMWPQQEPVKLIKNK